MTNDDTTIPDPFGPKDYAAVKEGIMRAFEEAAAAGAGTPPEASLTGMTPESARMIHEALDRFERAEGLNVLRFPSHQTPDTTTRTDGDEA